VKIRALDILVCPACKGELTLGVDSRQGSDVLEGTLECSSCMHAFEIRRGIPRFVRAESYASTFGYQWTWFRTVQLDSFNGSQESERRLAEVTGWSADDYRGRLVLDAGIGAGRFAEIVAAKGGEVFGIDLTAAIDAAWLNIGSRENVHLIQADIFALPFREGTFDLAYSIGVLHHTPDTRAAFDHVASTVKKGGQLALYLYSGYGGWYRGSDVIRRVTTRLPPGLMFFVSAVAVPLYYVYRLRVIGPVLQLLAPLSLHRNWRWRWLDTFDWYTPRFQWKHLYPEVVRWYRSNGFADIELLDSPICIRGVKTGC
jgi:SAM-dependent methyltransferase